jgi:hypothetical protein
MIGGHFKHLALAGQGTHGVESVHLG